jgi:hypothetical protein
LLWKRVCKREAPFLIYFVTVTAGNQPTIQSKIKFMEAPGAAKGAVLCTFMDLIEAKVA